MTIRRCLCAGVMQFVTVDNDNLENAWDGKLLKS